MKKIIAVGFGAGACVIAIVGLTSRLTTADHDRHCPPPDARCQSADPHCQSPTASDDCDHPAVHGAGHGAYSARADDDEAAGHAGFGESAGAHGGGGE